MSGTYTHDDGQITGTVDGATLTGRWTEAPTRLPPQDAGDLQLTMNADCTALSGFWRYGDKGHDKDGEWAGKRVGPPPTGGGTDDGGSADSGSGDEENDAGGAAVNLALASRGTRATQSSTYTGSCPAGADAAIDGVTDAGVAYGCDTRIAHTNLEEKPWWRVDLGSEHMVQRVVIWNRNDVAKERLTDFRVTLRDASGNRVYSKRFFASGGYPDPSLEINLGEAIRASQVEVRLNGRNYLTLAEVEVFGLE